MESWIVVVDDEALSLTNAKNLLSNEKMRVSCLRSGRDLMRFIEKNSPDLILLDIMMPEMDGFETYSALRRLEEEMGKRPIPVIFLTGENDSEIERRGLRAGASDFIRKPLHKDILISRINKTINNDKKIESLTEEATLDKLTGFLNKFSGTEKIRKLCMSRTGALMIFDLDNFKLVNDLFGHDMGDKVLEAFADIMRHNIRGEDVVSRIGGDEFMAFFIDVNKETAIEALSNRLNDQFFAEAEKVIGQKLDIPLGISIGVVMVPEFGTDYDLLFTLADNALYEKKQNGKFGYNIHSQDYFIEGTGCDLEKDIIRLNRIMDERNEKKGAVVLNQESFTSVYRFLMRLYKRYGGRAVEVLFSISGNKREIFSEFLNILKNELRKSDVIFQNRPDQFFVLLPELSEKDVSGMIKRVLDTWEATPYGMEFRVEYAFKGLVEEPFGKVCKDEC